MLITIISGLNWIVLGFNVKNLQLAIWMNLPIAGFCESSLYGLPIYLIWKFFSPDKKIMYAAYILYIKLFVMKAVVLGGICFPLIGACIFTDCAKKSE